MLQGARSMCLALYQNKMLPLLEEQLLGFLVTVTGNDQRWSLFPAAVLYSLYIHVIKISD